MSKKDRMGRGPFVGFVPGGPVQPTMACPKCGVELPDFDGFGVLAHVGSHVGWPDGCGYCTHPARDYDSALQGWVCGICGDIEHEALITETLAEERP